MKWHRTVASLFVGLIASMAYGAGLAHALPSAGPACATPAVAVTADSLAAAFDQHKFVFVGSTHGDAKINEFLICLVSRPTFQSRVTDILVEWAGPLHQRLLDRYLLTLDSVPADGLARVWFDTDRPVLWASLPQLREFLAAVRDVNRGLPPVKRIRVLGGNEPVDWAAVRTSEDLAPYAFKNNYTAHIITEHLAQAPGNRTLVVYGDGHIHHNGGTLMGALEAKIDRSQLFVVGTIHDLKPGERERVARFGDPTRPFFVDARRFPSARPFPADLFFVGPEPLTTYVDGVIYLGPERNRDLTNTIALSAAQRSELARRDSLTADPRRVMQIRYGARDRWFQAHPNHFPARP